ncbi:MAG: hypothetical protein IT373_32110 [Polyangiaceae bacterium]|nr:hypothetical protein [Polyangiaceae bacterium]
MRQRDDTGKRATGAAVASSRRSVVAWWGVGGAFALAAALGGAACASSTDTDGGGTGATGNTTGTGLTGGAGGAGGSVGGGGQGGGPCVPLSEELCDGEDNTCDDVVDEGCACIQGQTQPCYSGDPALPGVGECATGLQACDIHGEYTGPCVGEVLPEAETCDGADNDCNHAVDEGLGTVSCGLGACQVTVEACTNGQPVPCVPGNPGPVETCDGSDDNCNGVVDEGCNCVNGTTQPCYTGAPATRGVGECKDGLQTCVLGAWSACANDVLPTGEICDGKDNDCDNANDNGDPGGNQSCSTGGVGQCALGLTHCQSGQIACVQQYQPEAEVFDCKDNDCNGDTDEGQLTGCNTGLLGVCAIGTKVCIQGQVVCVQNVQPSADVCDGQDNNCDGATDEGDPGGGAVCATGQPGVCSPGVRHCVSGVLTCVANAQPSAEVCDGLDNNCAGGVDEGNPGGGAGCSTGQQGVCAAGTVTCQSGALTCVRNVAPSSETCDGLDNNCAGGVDEGNPGGGVACTTGLLGVCNQGTTACQNGALTCPQNVQPSSEVCDGADNNCNGATDENDPGGNVACSTGLPGVCSAGIRHCVSGALVCQQSVQPSGEVCDGLDNNCAGGVDEGNPGGGAACATGQSGVCSPGTQTCVAGSVSCVRNVNPSTETCNSLDDDCNGLVDDALVADGKPNTCANAASLTYTIAPAGQTLVTGVVDASGEDWFRVTFTSVGSPGQSYHPVIDLIAGNAEYRIRVYRSCPPAASECSQDIETFSMDYPANQQGCLSPTNHCTDQTTPRNATWLVRVFRRVPSPTNCTSYTVRLSNI